MKFMAPMFAALCDRRLHDHNKRSMDTRCRVRRPLGYWDMMTPFDDYKAYYHRVAPSNATHYTTISFKRRDTWY